MTKRLASMVAKHHFGECSDSRHDQPACPPAPRRYPSSTGKDHDHVHQSDHQPGLRTRAAATQGASDRPRARRIGWRRATFPPTVNDAGVVAGFYTDSHGTTRGFVDRRGVFTTVTVPGATRTKVSGINDRGVMVGFCVAKSGAVHGFIDWRGAFTTVKHPHAGTAAG